MSSQHTDVDDVTVVARPAPQPAPEAWFTGTPEDGVDARLELATLIAGSDSGDQVAVRDAQHPAGPALLFSLPEWNALHGREPELVDLR
jgi:hypothetical protein